jgi:hypothetical protein
MGERRGAYSDFVESTEGKRPLGRPNLRKEGKINIYLREVK